MNVAIRYSGAGTCLKAWTLGTDPSLDSSPDVAVYQLCDLVNVVVCKIKVVIIVNSLR